MFTLLALVLVDRWGRRKLMLIGAGGLFAVYLLIGGAYALHLLGLPVLLLFLSGIAIHPTTLASVTWRSLYEIYPYQIH
ncbi:MFS transporter, partial [Pseudoxanthomonas sp. KAs_5_3]|uniref:MFS transporter n=1 Tax=Pseudoxanthomonas sp. KAs_5_3 TaxID=2067658 RepID=UPI0018ECCF4A